MGTETLPDSTTVASGLLIKSNDFLTMIAALQGSLVGRNTSGLPSAGQSLGTSLYPWGNVHTDVLTIGGEVVNVSGLVSPANRIVSGKTRTTSSQPLFIDPSGVTNSVTLQGNVTELVLSIDAAVVTVNTDIVKTGLTVAPGSNNTCLINDPTFADQPDSKYYGEADSKNPTITIDNVGSEISSRVGQFIALKTSASEIMWGYLTSATEFTDVKRGYFFDKDTNPIVRETIADNDTLTLMETGWVFVKNDGLTIDVSYLSPVYSFTSPVNVVGQYWYDLENQTWKIGDGATYTQSENLPVGLCVINTTDCIASRSFDTYQDFKSENTIDIEVFSDDVIRTTEDESSINIYGSNIKIPFSRINWDNTLNMETGSVAANTNYYLYLSTDGEPIISLERPYSRTGDLRGRYHPYNNWRYVGEALTDPSANWLWSAGEIALLSEAKKVDFETKDLITNFINATQGTATAKRVSLLDSNNVPKYLNDLNVTWDITTDLEPGTSEQNSTHYGAWVDSNLNLVLAPDLENFADGTTAGKLVHSSGLFLTNLVHQGDILYNITTGIKTTALSDATVEGSVDCVDDIFVSGDQYKIEKRSPVGLGENRVRLCTFYNNSSGNFDDSYYTQVQDEKAYYGDGTDFSVTAVPSVVSLEGAIGFVRQVNDWTGKGTWKINFNVAFAVASSTYTGATMTMVGVVFNNQGRQAVWVSSDSALAYVSAGITVENSSNVEVAHASATFSKYHWSGDVVCLRKPTFVR